MSIKREALHNFIKSELGVDIIEIDDDTPLFSSGLIDSMNIIELIDYIESELGAALSTESINLDNLDSIARIILLMDEISGK